MTINHTDRLATWFEIDRWHLVFPAEKIMWADFIYHVYTEDLTPWTNIEMEGFKRIITDNLGEFGVDWYHMLVMPDSGKRRRVFAFKTEQNALVAKMLLPGNFRYGIIHED